MLKSRMALLVVLPALALGACGGSDSDSDSKADSGEAQIAAIVNAVGKDPFVVCANLTDELMENFGSEAECIRAGRASGEKPDGSVTDAGRVTIDGDRATASVTDDSGRTQDVAFLKEDGAWKIVG